MLRLNDLKNFLEAAPCTSFSEAARKAGITQPALSESIKRLESDLGEVLFYRAKSGISLTPGGRRALQHAKGVFGLLSELGPSKQPRASSITIGCHPVVGSYTLPVALGRLKESQPDYRIEIRHGLSRVIQDEIQKGLVDVGIVVNPVPNPDLVIRQAARDEVCVWKSRKHKPQNQVICDPELFQSQTILRNWKKRPQATLTSSSLELIARLTETGLGLGIIPARVVALTGAAIEPVAGAPRCEDKICIVSRPEFGGTDSERAVIEALKDSLRT